MGWSVTFININIILKNLLPPKQIFLDENPDMLLKSFYYLLLHLHYAFVTFQTDAVVIFRAKVLTTTRASGQNVGESCFSLSRFI